MRDGQLAQIPTPATPPSGRQREAVVVLDDDPVMEFWSAEIDEFRSRLRDTGAFSSIETRTLSAGPGDRIALAGSPDDPGSLGSGPLGPRAVLLVTHGRSLAWRRGLIAGLLTRWARDGQVAVVNLLPQQHWHDRGLRVTEVAWTPGEEPAPTAATPWRVAGLDLRSAEERSGDPGRTAVPILERGADWLDRWTRLSGGPEARTIRMPALLVAPDDTAEPDPARSARTLVARFRAGASPAAFGLATRLAAAPLNVRTMRAVQRMSRLTGPGPLTEVLTSELLRPVRQWTTTGDTRIVYEFVYGVRQQLLSYAYRDRTIEVQHIVESTLARDVEAVRNLALRVKDPRRAAYQRPSPAALPYLRVEYAVHVALGGPNLNAARQLGPKIGIPAPAQRRRFPHQNALPDSRLESAVSEILPSQGSVNPQEAGPSTLRTGHDPEGNTVPVTTDGLRTTPTRDPRLPAVVGGLPLRNANFTGRRELLDALHQRLRAGTTAVLPEAVHGAGGVGKSQLVIEYVYQHQQDFDLIWWIPAERPAQIQSALAELAGRLDLPVPSTANTAVPAVLDYLSKGRRYSNWLLIFDNAEDPDEVKRFFPVGGPGSIVVTSRNPSWSGIASTLPVDVFERQESIELMRRRDPDLPGPEANQLAAALGDLPLAIEAAAAWRAEMNLTVPEYMAHFQDSRRRLAAETPADDIRDFPIEVAAVWNVTLDGLRGLEPSALRLLQLCAFFAPEPISRILLSKPRALRIDPELDQLMRNKAQRDQAIATIGKLALARIDHRTGSFQMHRLVQRVLVHQMDAQTREDMRHAAHLLLAGNDPDQPDNAEHWGRYAELYPHIVASGAEECLDELVRDMILNEAVYLWRWGEHAEAHALAQRAYTSWIANGDETHPDSLRMAQWLGAMHFVVGDYAAARKLNSRTLELYRDALGEDDEQTLQVIGFVAADHRVIGNFDRALELSQTVYERALDNFGPDVPFTLRAAHNLAVSMRLSGYFGRALQLDNQTYHRLVQIYGTDHSDSLLTYGGINLDRRERGDYVTAHVDQETVVATGRRLLRYDDHPDLLRQNHHLASFRRKAGLHQDALDLSSDVLRRFQNRYGRQHPETVLALLAVSIDQRVTGDLAAARENGVQAVEGLRSLYGDDHPHTAGARSDLGVTLRLLDRYEDAREQNERAVRALTDRLGDKHPLVLAARINLASDHFELGDFEKAHALDLSSFAQCREVLGPTHPTTLACGVNLAADMRGLGQDAEASTLFEDTMDKFRDSLGADHPATTAADAGVRANCDIDPLPL